MEENMYQRTEMLLGPEAVEKLKKSHVAVFGIGGVGSFISEALARCGIGKLTLLDYDVVTESNINRQLHALNSTIGLYKVDVMKERILDINPKAVVNAIKLFYLPDSPGSFDWDFDYVADAVDNVTAKIHIIETAKSKGIRVISSMGTGNKIEASKLMVSDIYETSMCPLAKVMRKELRKRSIDSLKVVYSTEEPKKMSSDGIRTPPASIPFVPSCAGLIVAGEIIKELSSG